VAIVLEDDKVLILNVVRAGEAPPAVMEEHLPFAFEIHLCWPQAVAPPDTCMSTWWGSFPSTIEANLWGRRSLSQLMPWWMVTPN
jgi:hypothetical protein